MTSTARRIDRFLLNVSLCMRASAEVAVFKEQEFVIEQGR